MSEWVSVHSLSHLPASPFLEFRGCGLGPSAVLFCPSLSVPSFDFHRSCSLRAFCFALFACLFVVDTGFPRVALAVLGLDLQTRLVGHSQRFGCLCFHRVLGLKACPGLRNFCYRSRLHFYFLTCITEAPLSTTFSFFSPVMDCQPSIKRSIYSTPQHQAFQWLPACVLCTEQNHGGVLMLLCPRAQGQHRPQCTGPPYIS